MYRFLCSLLFLAFVSLGSSTNTWYVSTTGNDAGEGTYEDPFLTITEAIIHCSNMDFVEIFDGTYGGPMNNKIIIPPNMTISMYGFGTGPDGVIIDGTGSEGSIFSLIPSSDAKNSLYVGYMTIQNADTAFTSIGASNSLGLFEISISNSNVGIDLQGGFADLTNVNFMNNSPDTVGATVVMVSDQADIYLSETYFENNQRAIYCNNSMLSIYGTQFTQNGDFLDAVIELWACSAYLDGVLLLNSTTAAPDVNGSALYAGDGSRVTVEGCTFGWNFGAGNGGGFYCGAGATMSFMNVLFIDNVAAVGGAGDCAPSCMFTCEGCQLVDNDSTTGDQGSCNWK